AVQEGGVVVPDGADEDSGGAVGEGGGDDSGVLQALPAQFQHQALLGVHGGGFAGGDAEEGGVEAVDVVEVAAAPGVDLALGGDVGVEVGVGVPAFGRGGGDGVAALAQQVPEGGRVGGAGEAAGEADDGDLLGGCLLRGCLLGGCPGPRV